MPRKSSWPAKIGARQLSSPPPLCFALGTPCTHGREQRFAREPPKSGDGSKFPLLQSSALRPSAGTIDLKIDLAVGRGCCRHPQFAVRAPLALTVRGLVPAPSFSLP